MCEEWCHHKKKKLLKELNSNKVEISDILIHNVPKFNLMDFISLMLFTDTRIKALLHSVKAGGNID